MHRKILGNQRAQKLENCCSTRRFSCEKAGSRELIPAQKDWRWWMWIQTPPPRPAAVLGLLEAVPGIKGSQFRGARGWMDGWQHCPAQSPAVYFTSRRVVCGAKLQGHSKSVFSPRGREGRADRGRDCVCYQEITRCWAAFLTVFWALRTGFPELLEKQEQAEVLILSWQSWGREKKGRRK